MIKHIALTIIFITYPIISWAQTPEEKGLEIATKADQHDTGWQDSTSKVTMILKTRQGDSSERKLTVTALEMPADGDKTLIKFATPKDVKNTVLLTHSHKVAADDQWLYLPALKRTKRIASSNKSGPFVGSEYSYEDMTAQEVPKYTYKFIKDETYNGFECHVVERYPVDENSGYKRQVMWIDGAEYRIHKIEYYDRKDSHLKTLTAKNFLQYLDRYWRPEVSEMVNHQSGKSTTLIAVDYQFKTGLKERDFNPDRIGKRR